MCVHKLIKSVYKFNFNFLKLFSKWTIQCSLWNFLEEGKNDILVNRQADWQTVLFCEIYMCFGGQSQIFLLLCGCQNKMLSQINDTKHTCVFWIFFFILQRIIISNLKIIIKGSVVDSEKERDKQNCFWFSQYKFLFKRKRTKGEHIRSPFTWRKDTFLANSCTKCVFFPFDFPDVSSLGVLQELIDLTFLSWYMGLLVFFKTYFVCMALIYFEEKLNL